MHLLIDRCGGKKMLAVVIVIRYWKFVLVVDYQSRLNQNRLWLHKQGYCNPVGELVGLIGWQNVWEKSGNRNTVLQW